MRKSIALIIMLSFVGCENGSSVLEAESDIMITTPLPEINETQPPNVSGVWNVSFSNPNDPQNRVTSGVFEIAADQNHSMFAVLTVDIAKIAFRGTINDSLKIYLEGFDGRSNWVIKLKVLRYNIISGDSYLYEQGGQLNGMLTTILSKRK